MAAIFVQFADPPMRARLFERIVRSLKPGGVLILQGYTPKQLEYRTGGSPILSHLYAQDLLLAAERTLLAWQRTAIALMGFGFVVERFGLVLRMVSTQPLSPSQRGFSLWLGARL